MTQTLCLVLVLSFALMPACRSSESAGSSANQVSAPNATASSVTTGSGLRVVAPSLVCMVNNRFMGSAQIPTEVDGRTYYGCCPMCSGRLRSESSMRSAKDPVSGEDVDKATALIAATKDGSVLYFKSDKTLAAYRPPKEAP